MKRYDLG